MGEEGAGVQGVEALDFLFSISFFHFRIVSDCFLPFSRHCNFCWKMVCHVNGAEVDRPLVCSFIFIWLPYRLQLPWLWCQRQKCPQVPLFVFPLLSLGFPRSFLNRAWGSRLPLAAVPLSCRSPVGVVVGCVCWRVCRPVIRSQSLSETCRGHSTPPPPPNSWALVKPKVVRFWENSFPWGQCTLGVFQKVTTPPSPPPAPSAEPKGFFFTVRIWWDFWR